MPEYWDTWAEKPKGNVGGFSYETDEDGILNFGYGFFIQTGRDGEDLRDALGAEGMMKSDSGGSDLLTLPKGTKIEEKEGKVYFTLPRTNKILVISKSDKDKKGNCFVREA